MAKVGYIRISGDRQSTDLQEDAMKREGCEKVFRDKMTGKRFDRPGFVAMLDYARPGDVIVVWRLDRLGRTLSNLIETMNQLKERKIEFRSLMESIDTTTPLGTLLFHISGALAQFERDILIERTRAGLEAARARGRNGGRPKATDKMKSRDIERARELYTAKKNTVDEIMRLVNFKGSRTTFYKYVANGGETS